MARKSLQTLQAENLPRCTAADVVAATALTDAERAVVDEYLARFLKPSKNCVRCGQASFFTWGIQHGVGFCVECRYPARAYHYDVGPVTALRIVLQYHPSELEQTAPTTEAAS